MKQQAGEGPAPRMYDRRSLTYANSFPNFWTRHSIKAVEWMTGKLTVLRRVRQFEKMGAPKGRAFWPATMKAMGIDILTPEEQIARIPRTGPVVMVANHPHGLVDGMVMAEMIGRVRDDYKILSRALLTDLDESATRYMISVPFPHEVDAQAKMMAMREQATEHLKAGGLIALFPSGGVAAADTWFGPAIEGEWNVFTAKLIRTSGATVVPCYFTGQNSRAYQIANQISPILRQGLLIHEVVHSFDKPQKPVIGNRISPEDWAEGIKTPRRFMSWLRDRCMSLTENPDATGGPDLPFPDRD